MSLLYKYLSNRSFLWFLFIVNIAGTIYGYIWYGYQLAQTKTQFLLFVPDSPTASLFFVLVLLAFLLKRNWGLIEAFAIVTLFKYGVWAIWMNLLLLIVQGQLHWTGYMLMISHGAMAVQGLLYAPFFRIKAWHLIIVAIWTLHDVIIDYVYGQMPSYGILDSFYQPIGYFTFWFNIAAIGIAYVLGIHKKRIVLTLK